jgi:hypothetical protein
MTQRGGAVHGVKPGEVVMLCHAGDFPVRNPGSKFGLRPGLQPNILQAVAGEKLRMVETGLFR